VATPVVVAADGREVGPVRRGVPRLDSAFPPGLDSRLDVGLMVTAARARWVDSVRVAHGPAGWPPLGLLFAFALPAALAALAAVAVGGARSPGSSPREPVAALMAAALVPHGLVRSPYTVTLPLLLAAGALAAAPSAARSAAIGRASGALALRDQRRQAIRAATAPAAMSPGISLHPTATAASAASAAGSAKANSRPSGGQPAGPCATRTESTSAREPPVTISPTSSRESSPAEGGIEPRALRRRTGDLASIGRHHTGVATSRSVTSRTRDARGGSGTGTRRWRAGRARDRPAGTRRR